MDTCLRSFFRHQNGQTCENNWDFGFYGALFSSTWQNQLLQTSARHENTVFSLLRLLFSLKPKEMAKMRLLALWIDQK